MTDPIRSALEAAREALRLLLATPEIADAHPADKDESPRLGSERPARPSPRSMRLLRPDAPEGRTNTGGRTKMIDVTNLPVSTNFAAMLAITSPTGRARHA